MESFRQLVAAGAPVEHIIQLAEGHIRDLKALSPETEGRDDAIDEANAFLLELVEGGPFNLVVKGKPRTFTAIKKIEAAVGGRLTPDDIKTLYKASKKGDVLYIAFNPYDAEMATGEPDARIGVLIASSQEELDRRFYQLREEI